jgi:hypothetical protein
MFDGPKLKVEWANHHIEKLTAVVADFFNTNPCVVELEPIGNSYFVNSGVKNGIPKNIPLIIGDIVHNLSASLDFLIADLIRLADKEPKWTCFPFRRTRNELIEALHKGELKAADPAMSDIILDRVQPYIGGYGDLLVKLHDLDVMGKHSMIVPVLAVTRLNGVNFITADGGRGIECAMIVASNGVVRQNSFGGRFTVFEHDGKPTCDIVFDKSQPFNGRSIIPTLFQLSQFVFQVIQVIEYAWNIIHNPPPPSAEQKSLVGPN